jgi:hypothetical protein
MRPDMAKVIVERPRYGSCLRGHRKGYRRDLQRYKLDEQPKREKIRRHDKRLNEHLAPLRRFLHQQVGRPWNLVYAEMCQHIRFDNVVQDHIKTHLFEYVEIHVQLIEGVPCYASSSFGLSRFGMPLRSWSERFPKFYVCPKSGLLKKAKKVLRPRRNAKQTVDRVIEVDHDLVFLKFQDAWHRVRWAEYPRRERFKDWSATVHDAMLNRPISRDEAVHTYRRPVYAAEARLATRQEIRRWCEPLKAPNRVR